MFVNAYNEEEENLKRATITEEHTYRLTQNNMCIYENGRGGERKKITSNTITKKNIDEIQKVTIEHINKTNAVLDKLNTNALD